MSVTMPEPATPPFVNNLGALTAIPVYTDPKVPAGTATLDHDPQDPRHITGIRAASDVVLTAEQTELVRDHFRAMDERAGQALAEWQQLATRLGINTGA